MAAALATTTTTSVSKRNNNVFCRCAQKLFVLHFESVVLCTLHYSRSAPPSPSPPERQIEFQRRSLILKTQRQVRWTRWPRLMRINVAPRMAANCWIIPKKKEMRHASQRTTMTIHTHIERQPHSDSSRPQWGLWINIGGRQTVVCLRSRHLAFGR